MKACKILALLAATGTLVSAMPSFAANSNITNPPKRMERLTKAEAINMSEARLDRIRITNRPLYEEALRVRSEHKAKMALQADRRDIERLSVRDTEEGVERTVIRRLDE
ncbi:MAG: hypothetical protein GC136_05725 [Alphaproteobacteria bacterium]|nr:hypothetical protein [Alphaproteobacteria bacterium]